MRERDDGIFKFLVGIFLGGFAGFVIGVLTAERPGRELRRDIEVNSHDFLDKLRDNLDDLKDKATDRIRDFQGFADERLKASAKNIQDQVASLGRQLEELTKKQANAVKEEVHS